MILDFLFLIRIMGIFISGTSLIIFKFSFLKILKLLYGRRAAAFSKDRQFIIVSALAVLVIFGEIFPYRKVLL